MKGFTNDKNLDMIIMNKLNDYELGRVCQTNSYAKSICDSEIFWLNRYIMKYGKFLGTPEDIRKRGVFNTWKQYYTSTKKALEKGTYENVMRNYKVAKRYFIQGSREPIEDQNQLFLLKMRIKNSELLEEYAYKGDITQVRKIIDETDPTLIDYAMGYHTNNYDIFRIFYDMKIPYKLYHDLENYDIKRDLLIDGVIDVDAYYYDSKFVKMAIEYNRVDAKGMKRALKHLLKRIDSLENMKDTYLMLLERIE